MTVMVEGLGVWSHYELCVRAATEGGGDGEENCTTQRTLGAGEPPHDTAHVPLYILYCCIYM